MAKKEWKVPFDEKGMMHWAWKDSTQVEWVEPYSFEANLRLDEKINSGRSAKYVTWHDDENEARYFMFIKDLVLLVARGTVSKGLVEGTWTFAKRGQNFGITYLGPRS